MKVPGPRPGRSRLASRPPVHMTRRSGSNRRLPPPLRPGIRAVTFDAGGTLIEVWPSVGQVYAEVATRHGVADLSPDLLNRRFAAAWRAAKDFSYSRADWAALVDATFRGLEPVMHFLEKMSVHCIYISALACGWRMYEKHIRVM